MPKKAASSKSGSKQVSAAQFLKQMGKKKAIAKAAAAAEKPAGIADDSAVLKKLGLEEAKAAITISAAVSNIGFGFAKNDPNRPYLTFAYVLKENSTHTGKGKGTIVSNYCEMSESKNSDGEVWRTEEEAMSQVFWEFEALGEDVEAWANSADPIKAAIEAAQRITKEKPEIDLTISAYERRNGDLGMNVAVAGLSGNDDLESDEEDEEDTSVVDEGGEDEGEFNPDEWIGGWVDWTDDEGSVTFIVESYNADDDTFSGKDEEGNEYEGAPVDDCEWSEDQGDEE